VVKVVVHHRCRKTAHHREGPFCAGAGEGIRVNRGHFALLLSYLAECFARSNIMGKMIMLIAVGRRISRYGMLDCSRETVQRTVHGLNK
jgi:hypothetical protein